MGNALNFRYFYGQEGAQFSFFRIPKVLVKDGRFSGLSCEAKMLYGLFLDRMSLSMANGWVDGENRVFIIYTIQELQNDLNCGKGKAVKVMAELDSVKGIGLIERRRRGLGQPDLIYVKNFVTQADGGGGAQPEGGNGQPMGGQRAAMPSLNGGNGFYPAGDPYASGAYSPQDAGKQASGGTDMQKYRKQAFEGTDMQKYRKQAFEGTGMQKYGEQVFWGTDMQKYGKQTSGVTESMKYEDRTLQSPEYVTAECRKPDPNKTECSDTDFTKTDLNDTDPANPSTSLTPTGKPMGGACEEYDGLTVPGQDDGCTDARIRGGWADGTKTRTDVHELGGHGETGRSMSANACCSDSGLPQTDRLQAMDGHEAGKPAGYAMLIRENIGYEEIRADAGSDERRLLDMLYGILCDTVCDTQTETVRIGGRDMPHDVVKSRFLKLGRKEIRYALDVLLHPAGTVRSQRPYAMTVLYNSLQNASPDGTEAVDGRRSGNGAGFRGCRDGWGKPYAGKRLYEPWERQDIDWDRVQVMLSLRGGAEPADLPARQTA